MPLATASVHPYRTKKGTRYCIRFRENGKQRHETVPGYGRQAKEIARERASEIELGRHYVAPPQTLGAFLGEWLERQENQVKPSTLKRKREALRALGVLSEGALVDRGSTTRPRENLARQGGRVALSESSSAQEEEARERSFARSVARGTGSGPPHLASISLDRLQVAEVEDALAALARRAPRQAQMARAALLNALKDAERRGQRIDKGLLEIKANRYQSREPRFLTWEQVTELQSWMPEYVCRIVPIAALTGAREGELFDLKESDLDLDKAVMRIRSGKTEAATRSVTLPATAVQLFREQLLARTHTEGGYVFPAPMGGRWSIHNFLGRVFRKAVRDAKLAGLTFHDLRHTYVSLMGSVGVHPSVIAAQIGHKDGGALLLRRYRHIFPHEGDRAAMQLDALVQTKEQTEEEHQNVR